MTSMALFSPGTRAAISALNPPPGAGDPFILGDYATVGNVHVNQALTNLLVGYDPGGYVADLVLPPLPVKNESDLYYRIDRASSVTRVETLTPDRAAAREVDFRWDRGVYNAQRYALATTISDRERNNADDQLTLEATSTQLIQDLIRLDLELKAAALLSVANTSGVVLSGANQFDNANFTASGIPIEQRIDDAKASVRAAIGRYPNTIVIPAAVAQYVKRDPKIRELTKYTTNVLVNGDLPDTLWGMRVIIPEAVYSTSNEAAANPAISDIWGKAIRVMYVAPTPAMRTPSTGYQFRVTSDDFRVYEWREERRHIDCFEVGVTQDMALVVPRATYVIEAAIS